MTSILPCSRWKRKSSHLLRVCSPPEQVEDAGCFPACLSRHSCHFLLIRSSCLYSAGCGLSHSLPPSHTSHHIRTLPVLRAIFTTQYQSVLISSKEQSLQVHSFENIYSDLMLLSLFLLLYPVWFNNFHCNFENNVDAWIQLVQTHLHNTKHL